MCYITVRLGCHTGSAIDNIVRSKAGEVALTFSTIALLATALACAPASARIDNAQEHLGAGLKLFQLERYSEAAREFELSLKADPGLSEARYHLGVCYFNERHYPDAREQFQRLDFSGYERKAVTYYLGRLDLLGADLDSAIRRFESLSRSEPFEDTLYYLGSALMRKRQFSQAIFVLRRQIQYNPRDFRAHNLLARAYMSAGRPEQAESEFQQSERLHRYYSESKQDLTACRGDLASGQVDHAWARCGSTLDSDDIDKLVAVGMMFGEFQSYDHALQLFQKALGLDPESPEINYNLGFTYFQQARYAEARNFLDTALRVRPDFFEALAVQGAVLYKLHQNAAARRLLDRAHSLRPDDVGVTRLLAQVARGSRP